MANRTCRRCGARVTEAAAGPAPRTEPKEPVMRRWPHPVTGAEARMPPDPTLHYIRCALSYQNQLLADIKSLLQQLVEDQEEECPSE